jgi:Tol biopolymer transport system component
MWTEHDYQPKFSPNGVGLAYVRSFQAHSLLTSLTPDPDIQTIHIINVNTGADIAVLQFPSGRYVTALDWSPDGTQLVFDVSVQATNSVVGPLQQGTAETN